MFRTKFWLAAIGIALLLTFAFGPGVLAETTVGSTSGKLAVTPAGYDDMKSVLEKLGVAPEELTFDQMTTAAALEKYDAIYINCAGEAESPSDEMVSAIKEYVKNGGVIYASDFAAGVVEKAFPGKINFNGGSVSSAHIGSTGDVAAKVVDSGLASVLGQTSVTIKYDLGAWVVVDSPGAGTRVLMTGDVPTTGYDASAYQNLDYSDSEKLKEAMEKIQSGSTTTSNTIKDKPLVLTFSEGKGEVLYTTFHNEAQLTKEVEAIINWFGIRTRAGRLASATRELVIKGDDIALQEIVDGINKGETKTYYFNATGKADFKLTLNFGGSELGMTITDPAGNEVISQDVQKPPYTTSVQADEGKYKIVIEGKDVPENNYPFVLLASGPKSAAADEIIVGTASDNKSGTSEKSIFQRIISGFYWAVGIGVVVIVLIIILIIVLIVRASRRKAPVAQNPEEKKE